MTRCFVRLAAVLSVLGSVLASVSTAQQAGTTPPPPFPREAPVDHGYAAWSPDDQRIAYMTLPGRAGTVFVTSIGGTPQAVFTDAAQYDGPAWSPDGTRFAFGSNRGGTWAIWVASANGSGARAITPNQLVEVHAPSWSRDGSRIAYSAISRLPVVMVASVNDRIPPRRLASGWRPRWSPDGNRIAYTDRYTEGGKELEAVAIVPAEGGPGVRLLSTVRELSPHTLSADWSPDGRRIVVPRRIEGAGNRSALLAVDAEADTAVTLATVDCLAADPAWSHRGDRIAFTCLAPDHAGEIHVVSLGDGTQAAITRQPRGAAARPIEYPSEGGVSIPAWLYVPAVTKPGPALVWVHGGGPGEGNADDVYDVPLQYFVSQGYTVIAPNFRGSVGHGDRIAAFPGVAGVVKDLIAAAQHLRTLPSVDRTRIGIIGFSGGGFWTTAALQSADSPFRAGVDFFGPVDFARLYETAPQQRPLIERFLGRPGQNASAFQDASPVFHVDRITVPMLVVHGDADRVIPIDQSLRFVQAMQTAGKPVEFLHLTGGHGFEGQEQATAFETAATFLGRHLGAN